MERFITWDQIDVRVSGAKMNGVLRQMLATRPPSDPIESLELQFSNGLLRVVGSIRKFISIPFSVDIPELPVTRNVVRVPLRNAAAFGAIPIPQFLFAFVKNKLPEIVSYEEPATLVLSLDRFLPNFVDADVQRIRITEGGLAVTLGRGGADPPLPTGGIDGRNAN